MKRHDEALAGYPKYRGILGNAEAFNLGEIESSGHLMAKHIYVFF